MFQKNGIEHINNFLDIKQIDQLNNEIDEISKSYLINGVTRASIWINKNLCEINSPIINIKNTNLLEIALKICKNLNDKTSKKFTLSNVRVIIEKKNSHPITWHTDQTKGIVRAIIYLKGGEQNNGNLSYVKESHLKDYDKKIHKVDPHKEGLSDKVLTLNTEVGDLIFFDINGIHKKNTVLKERRILFFEFHDGFSKKPIGQVVFDNSKITKNIQNNINFLLPNNGKIVASSSKYSNHLPEETPLKIFYYYLENFYKVFYARIRNKIFRLIR